MGNSQERSHSDPNIKYNDDRYQMQEQRHAEFHRKYRDFLLETDINDYRECSCISNRLIIETDNPAIIAKYKDDPSFILRSIDDSYDGSSGIIENYLIKYYDKIKHIYVDDDGNITFAIIKLSNLIELNGSAIVAIFEDKLTMKHPKVSFIPAKEGEKLQPYWKHKYLQLNHNFFEDSRYVSSGMSAGFDKIHFVVEEDINGFAEQYGLNGDSDIEIKLGSIPIVE